MKSTWILTILFLTGCFMLGNGQVAKAAPLGTAFTYQGRLLDANDVADRSYDFRFRIYNADSGGSQVGADVNVPNVDVIDGYFMAELDFGNIFDSNAVWLDIGVRPGALGDPNAYTTLSPRQLVTPAPYALYALNGGGTVWQPSGSNIFYTGGNVGINSNNPTAPLEVWGNTYIHKGATTSLSNTSLTVDGGGSGNIMELRSSTGVTRAIVTVNGYVGLGTATPTARLEVAGQIKMTGGGPGAGKVLTSDAAGLASWQTVSATSMSWANLTEIPAGFADGVDDIATSMPWASITGMPAGFADGVDNVGLVAESDPQVSSAVSNSIPKWNGMTLIDSVIYNNGGNVGIGTSNPTHTLDITGDIRAESFTADSVLSVTNSPLDSGMDAGVAIRATAHGHNLSKAVYGEASPNGDGSTTFGGYFTSGGSTGTGVYGSASNTGNNFNYGGYFEAAGTMGRAVYGIANNTGNYANFGGYFRADGKYGQGVYGKATGSNGIGIYGESTGIEGRGIFGYASNTGDVETSYGGYFEAVGRHSRGVYGETNGREGSGVYGYASYSDSNNVNYGGYFEAAGGGGRGVYGHAWIGGSFWGDYIGVYGDASIPGHQGYGVMGYGNHYDFYAAGSGTNYGPFTGGHEAKLSDDFPIDTKAGMIVSITGKTEIRRDDKGEISISSTLPTVKLCNVPNDKAVFGVFVAECSLPKDHWYIAKEGKRFATVNALGEGRAWVCNINGEVQVGDYITTSTVPGYGQKQSDDLLRSCTLGKATESVDWDSVTETVEFGGQVYKVYLIAVVYTAG
jgi:hypothetical protein